MNSKGEGKFLPGALNEFLELVQKCLSNIDFSFSHRVCVHVVKCRVVRQKLSKLS